MQRITCWHVFATVSKQLILTWRGSKPDHQGASSRARLLHCTPLGLTPAIIPNANNSTVQFLVAGTCVRASPLQTNKKKNSRMFWTIHWGTAPPPYTYHAHTYWPVLRISSRYRARVRSVPARGLPRAYLLPRSIGLGLDPFPRGIYLGFICLRGVLS